METLPRWDVSRLYPGLDSPEFAQAWEALVRAIDDLVALFDRYGVERLASPPPLPEAVIAFDEVLTRYNEVLREEHTLGAYIQSFLTTDSRDARAQSAWSEFQQRTLPLSLLNTRLIAWIGSLDVEGLLERSAVAREHEFAVRRAQEWATHLMSPAEEALAIELDLTGGAAWAKLYDTFVSQLAVKLVLDGEERTLPMSAVRNLAYDPDRTVRQRAYEAELSTWEQSVVPIAAALNSIKGQVNMLTRRRGWASPLDAALFVNHIDRPTLDAMMEAAWEYFPHFRRYLHAKARLLGVPRLAWYDLFAPVGRFRRQWTFAEAREFILQQFGTFSPRLRAMAERAFAERWIDAEPRPGKQDGAFCMWLREDESLVLLNYQEAYGKMSTLAHELGHAYHNLNLARRTMIQRRTPMTLAETASIFCETIVKEAALAEADEEEQMAILEGDLQSACQVVVDITSRFLFESRVFEGRLQRELTPEELCEAMLNAQKQTYGDGLDPAALHPYMWAAKPHYYSADLSFYNFPYMFGLLFGLGLYARYREDPQDFRARYDDLLSSTGMADAATLAGRFGMDIRSPHFWRQGLEAVRMDIDRFVALADQVESHRTG
ncbi:MAG: M3 family oligoendopeptidase [Anaerolineae bacterium]